MKATWYPSDIFNFIFDVSEKKKTLKNVYISHIKFTLFDYIRSRVLLTWINKEKFFFFEKSVNQKTIKTKCFYLTYSVGVYSILIVVIGLLNLPGCLKAIVKRYIMAYRKMDLINILSRLAGLPLVFTYGMWNYAIKVVLLLKYLVWTK